MMGMGFVPENKLRDINSKENKLIEDIWKILHGDKD